MVTLIPKHDQANEAKDFRPITGCITFYKIKSKVLTSRLGIVLKEVIHPIYNHILLSYELLRGYNRKGGPPRCMMQINLQKSYDMVDWDSLETVLAKIGILGKFIKWILMGTNTVSYRFNINDKYSEVLDAKRGTRQGDHVSPLIFVVMMEYLNRVLIKMAKSPDFNFHSKCEKMHITHLSFPDDLLLYNRGDVHFMDMITKAFNNFSGSIGLIGNQKKCKAFYCRMDKDTEDKVLQRTCFMEGELPIRDLGIPLARKKLSMNHYLLLIDKMVSRTRHWTAYL